MFTIEYTAIKIKNTLLAFIYKIHLLTLYTQDITNLLFMAYQFMLAGDFNGKYTFWKHKVSIFSLLPYLLSH